MNAPSPDPSDLARLINAQWGFASMWTTLELAIEQFEVHAPARQNGLLLEWQDAHGNFRRVTAEELHALLGRRTSATPTDDESEPPHRSFAEASG